LDLCLRKVLDFRVNLVAISSEWPAKRMCGQTASKTPNCFRPAGAGILRLEQRPWAAEDAGDL